MLNRIRLIERQNDPQAPSHGQKQWLEIGMLLVQDAQLLLVDEPAAGMTDAETKQTAELLQEISGTNPYGEEHDMEFVKALIVRFRSYMKEVFWPKNSLRSTVQCYRDRSLPGGVCYRWSKPIFTMERAKHFVRLT